jgi:hypothetical protein
MATKETDYDLVGSYDNQRISTISAERTVNMFEYLDPNGKRPKVLLSTAGLVNAGLDLGSETDGARQAFVFNNAIYQVYGNSVYRTTGSTGLLSTSIIGTLSTSAGYVGIDANTYQVIFVDGEEGWIWDVNATTFEKITDTGFPANPIDVCYLDGFFLVANGSTNTFQLSSINQGMVWSGGTATTPTGTFTADTATDILTLSVSNANFATGVPVTLITTGTLPAPLVANTTYYVIRVGSSTTNPGTIKLATSYNNAIANIPIDITLAGAPTNSIIATGQLQLGSITSHPGNIVACKTLHRRIFLFSQNYCEVWENAGLGANLPFRRNNSLLMEVGTPAIGSVSVGFDRMFFLAQDKDGLAGVMEVKGTESMLVSNRALDFQLAQYAANPDTGVADARGILIKENGLIFYRLNFTLANHTFVLNVTMSTAEAPKWHEEEVLNGDRHPAQTHAYFDGVNYYGDYKKPLFYIVSDGVSTNNGEAIRRMRIGKQMSPNGYNRLRIDRFQVDLLQGQLEIDEFISIALETENLEDLLTESNEIIDAEQSLIITGGQPTVFLAISKDGGQTYGNYLHAPMGKIGERTYRTLWRKLGVTPRGQGFTPKIEFFNDIPFVLLGAAWAFEVLPE